MEFIQKMMKMVRDKNSGYSLNQQDFLKQLKKMCPSIKEEIIDGKSFLKIPPLEQCREEFENYLIKEGKL